MIVVSDTSPISNLAAIGQLQLLQQLYKNIIIPTAVYQELLNSGDTDPGALAVQSFSWIQVRSITNISLFQSLTANLDPGEAEAITLAVELSAERLIIDERRGRNEALNLGIKVTGILGVLLAAKQQGLIVQVKPLLDNLTTQGFWMRQELYAEVLLLAGE
jgi:predicted nucleic acid-binding protein